MVLLCLRRCSCLKRLWESATIRLQLRSFAKRDGSYDGGNIRHLGADFLQIAHFAVRYEVDALGTVVSPYEYRPYFVRDSVEDVVLVGHVVEGGADEILRKVEVKTKASPVADVDPAEGSPPWRRPPDLTSARYVERSLSQETTLAFSRKFTALIGLSER